MVLPCTHVFPVLYVFSENLNGFVTFQTKTEKSTLRQKLVALTHEAQKLEKLVKIAKPVRTFIFRGLAG